VSKLTSLPIDLQAENSTLSFITILKRNLKGFNYALPADAIDGKKSPHCQPQRG
jgi:hypothetical protein